MEQRLLITKAKSGVLTTAFHEFTVSSQDCRKVLVDFAGEKTATG